MLNDIITAKEWLYLIEVLKQKENNLNFLDSTLSPFEMNTLDLFSVQ